jgi:hypothetical protein
MRPEFAPQHADQPARDFRIRGWLDAVDALTDEVIQNLANIACVPVNQSASFRERLKFVVAIGWMITNGPSSPAEYMHQQESQLAKVEEAARALQRALQDLDEDTFSVLSKYVLAAELFEIGGTVVERAARVGDFLQGALGLDRGEISNFAKDVLTETFVSGDPLQQRRARADFAMRFFAESEFERLETEFEHHIMIVDAIAEGAGYCNLWKRQTGKRGPDSTMPPLGQGPNALLRSKSSRFDDLVISILDLAHDSGGRLTIDKNYGTGTLIDFLDAVRPFFPTERIPNDFSASRLVLLKSHWTTNRPSQPK